MCVSSRLEVGSGPLLGRCDAIRMSSGLPLFWNFWDTWGQGPTENSGEDTKLGSSEEGKKSGVRVVGGYLMVTPWLVTKLCCRRNAVATDV